MLTTLYELQRDFLASVYDTACVIPFLDNIQVHTRVIPAMQFTIYRDSIVGRFQKALQVIYPVCYKLVGHDFFMHMASCYIEETPSRSPDLNTYGNTLPDFIRHFDQAQHLAYLADIAALEWAWHRLYGAPDTPPFDFQKLAHLYQTAAEDIQFLLAPRATLLTSPYPIHRIWEMNQDNTIDDATITLKPHQTYYIYVWQHQHVFRIQQITAVEWQILTGFQQSLTFATVCEQASTLFPDCNLAELLPAFVTQGWIADVCYSQTKNIP